MINRIRNRHGKELLLATTLLFGFVLAEVPANIKDYTQTDARYAIENYGSGLHADVTRQEDSTCQAC